MTAQIAIMNKNAVALATDSAVTSRNPRGTKIHNSANKLFTLSKYHPVGVMVHANAEFMGFPWETLVKVYRRQLGATSFDQVTAYAEDFFKFLLGRAEIFDTTRQENWFRSEAEAYASALNADFVNRVRRFFEESGEQLDEPAVIRLLEEFVGERETGLQQRETLSCYSDEGSHGAFIVAATPVADDVIEKSFQDLPIGVLKARLRNIVLRRFMTDSGMSFSGLVFAGFGEREFLPVVESFWTDGIFADQLRRVPYDSLSGNMNENSPASIFPFAQSDSVFRFLQGIDPAYKTQAIGLLDLMGEEISNHVNISTSRFFQTEEERRVAALTLAEAVAGSKQRLFEKLGTMEGVRFLAPVMDVIASLPKEDLAAIAESLVNLTSFQRKILQEAETVGGPIDVAVISKGDGFVWIKRKHYFDKDLNPAFFANYYRGNADEN